MADSTESPLVTYNFCSVNSNHCTYLSKNRSTYEYLSFTATCSFDITGVGLLDTGSSQSLIPAQLLPEAILNKLDQSSETFTGISNTPIKAVGTFRSTFTTCGIVLKDILFHVLPANCPVLLGQNILRHPAILRYEIDHTAKKCRFITAAAPGVGDLLPGPHSITWSHCFNIYQNSPDDDLPPIDDDYEPEAIIPKSDPALLRTVEEKIKWLKSELNMTLSHDNLQELEIFADLVIEHKAVFGVGKNNLGKFPKKISIPTTGTPKSSNGKNHIAQAHKPLVQKEVEKMLAAGVIEPCSDSQGFNSPLVVVKKKDGTLRVCCNFKPTLNTCLANPDPFPMASTDEVFSRFKPGDSYFSSMDLLKGYWQCELLEEDRHKTAFTFNNVTYQFCRLPFGLTTAGNSFSRQLAEVLQDCLREAPGVDTYLDDIAIHTDNFEQFIDAHRKVFQALIKNGGKLKPEKCEFLRPKIKFLGRIVSNRGMEPDPDHVQGIHDMRPPKTKRQLASLVGRLHWLNQFIGCRMHEQVKATGYSALMEPIYDLYRNTQKKFVWTDSAQKAFDNIKKRLSHAPFISFSHPDYPYTLTTDASNYGCAGILMQQRDGKYHVIAAISKTFTPTQSRWSATEREAWAVVWAIQKLSHFLLDKPFVVFTDHKSLQYIDRKEFSNPKIQNWQLRLSRYQFTVQYLEGRLNVFADWLSRHDDLPPAKPCDNSAAGRFFKLENSPLRVYVPSWCENLAPKDELKLELESQQSLYLAPAVFLAHRDVNDLAANGEMLKYMELSKAQRDDLFLAKIINSLAKIAPGKTAPLLDSLDRNSEKYPAFAKIASNLFLDPSSGLLMARRKDKNPQMVVPNSLQRYYLHSAHDNSSAHGGRKRVSACLDDFFWEGKEADIVDFINSCTLCSNRKGRYGQRPIPTGHNLRGSYPFQVIYIDYIVMPQVRGLRRALTLMCPFSKWIEVFPLAQDTAFNTAKCLARFILKHRVVPEIISCDRGRHFTGAIFAETCLQLGIKLNLHVSWRPQSTGCLERAHRTLKNSLFIMALERNSNWVDILPYVVSALNNCMHRATRTTPFYCLYGRHGNIDLPEAPSNHKTASSPLEYGISVSNALKDAYRAIQIANKDADDVLERKVDRTASKCTLEVGQKVCLYRPHASGNTHRMPWSGEYKILETNGLVSKITAENGWTDWVHNTHLKRIYDRPEDFDIDEPPKFLVHQMPVAPVLPSGRGDKPVLLKPEKKPVLPKPEFNQSKAPSSASMPQAPLPPKREKKNAKTVSFRTSGRIKKPVEKLQLDHSKYKTYAAVCYMPNACPSPSQTFTRA